MKAGETQLYIFPGDTQPTPVPVRNIAEAVAAGAKAWKPDLRKMAQAARPFAAVGLPGSPGNTMAGEFLTDPQTVAMAATAPLGGAPMLLRSGVGALSAGSAAASQGQNVLGNAALAGAPEPVGDLLKAGGKATAEMAMKTSLGRAAVGSVQKALKYGLAPTQKFLDFVAEKIGRLKSEAVAAANALEAAGHATTYDELAAPLRRARARYAKHDVTGSQTEDALDEIMGEMEAKIGPQVSTTPASPIVAPGRRAADAAGSARPVVTTVTPPRPITPTQLQEINQIAGQKLKDLFAAKQGKLGVLPDPRELGYMKVWARSKQLLERMGGDVGKSIGQANSEMQNLYKMDALARNAGMRAHGLTGFERGAGVAGTIGGLTTGALTHDPLAVVAGVGSIPLMLGLHGASSPTGMAAIARGLHGPAGQAAAGGIPRLGAVGVGQFLNRERRPTPARDQ